MEWWPHLSSKRIFKRFSVNNAIWYEKTYSNYYEEEILYEFLLCDLYQKYTIKKGGGGGNKHDLLVNGE